MPRKGNAPVATSLVDDGQGQGSRGNCTLQNYSLNKSDQGESMGEIEDQDLGSISN
eukprot:CAMPEP_0170480742 /NCGR_PEP_ID=MMETSP0208-20121228/1465_1 /TAXON_ID=197538 /ORGANISM="Strombidium inclinatum, Strain S3" /LENGTH=55 /DNA_ID=CAMNT_0010753337 /DNA_START=971 /DNA_END=1135 /DNA_ORIENTATION=-